MPYFNYADVSESISAVIDEIEKERDPLDRSRLLKSFIETTSTLLTSSMQRLCFDLFKAGLQTSEIADQTGLSQRAVKRLIGARATSIGVPNPLIAERIDSSIDIRALVKH